MLPALMIGRVVRGVVRGVKARGSRTTRRRC